MWIVTDNEAFAFTFGNKHSRYVLSLSLDLYMQNVIVAESSLNMVHGQANDEGYS